MDQSHFALPQGSTNKNPDHQRYHADRREKTRAALFSILSNSLLVLLKLIVGFWTGSVSILSEAVHSATDLMASGIAFVSVRASDNPPDEEHPYGHGKIESLSGLIEALLIFFAAGFIIYEAVHKITNHEAPTRLGLGVGVMAFSALANVVISRYLYKVSKRTDSLALHADAEHLRTDVLTSAGVIVGLLLVQFTGRVWFDPACALVVALMIIHSAYRLSREALSPLLDARLPVREEEAIQKILDTDLRVLGYHKLRTRKSGSQRHADVHVQIDDDCSLVEAHDLTEELEDQIRDALPLIHINIHIEPYRAEMAHQQEVHGVNYAASADTPDTHR